MDIDKINQIEEALNELDSAMKKANGVLGKGPANYYFKKLKMYYEGCMAAAKFQPGARVRLKYAPNCDNGWATCKHFLIEGAVGTVMSHDYTENGYVYYVMFDEESWKDTNGTIHPIEFKNKHTFCLPQKILKRVKYEDAEGTK